MLSITGQLPAAVVSMRSYGGLGLGQVPIGGSAYPLQYGGQDDAVERAAVSSTGRTKTGLLIHEGGKLTETPRQYMASARVAPQRSIVW